MASFTISSFFRGIYYYVLSLLAALAVSIKPITNRLGRRIGRSLHDPDDFVFNLTPYKHHRGSQSNTRKQSDRYWSIKDFPVVRKSLKTRDGVIINYYIINPGNPRLIVFANGLGLNSDFSIYSPIVHRYGKQIDGDFTFLTWDYRGLFESSDVARPRRLAIHNHAEDLYDILKNEGRTSISLLCGFSMGVQVSLEFTVLYPEIVNRLALLNGTYGNVFESGFQPFFRVPMVSVLINLMIETLQDRPLLLRGIVTFARWFIWLPVRLYSEFFGSPLLKDLLGDDYLINFLRDYIRDLLADSTHTLNYLRLFQELHAHSVYHLLPSIIQPTLIVSGLLDVLTPAYQSFEMARKIKHSKHIVCPMASHAALLESPERVLKGIVELLETDHFLPPSSSPITVHSKLNENKPFEVEMSTMASMTSSLSIERISNSPSESKEGEIEKEKEKEIKTDNDHVESQVEDNPSNQPQTDPEPLESKTNELNIINNSITEATPSNDDKQEEAQGLSLSSNESGAGVGVGPADSDSNYDSNISAMVMESISDNELNTLVASSVSTSGTGRKSNVYIPEPVHVPDVISTIEQNISKANAAAVSMPPQPKKKGKKKN